MNCGSCFSDYSPGSGEWRTICLIIGISFLRLCVMLRAGMIHPSPREEIISLHCSAGAVRVWDWSKGFHQLAVNCRKMIFPSWDSNFSFQSAEFIPGSKVPIGGRVSWTERPHSSRRIIDRIVYRSLRMVGSAQGSVSLSSPFLRNGVVVVLPKNYPQTRPIDTVNGSKLFWGEE